MAENATSQLSVIRDDTLAAKHRFKYDESKGRKAYTDEGFDTKQ
jgi:hypothetical protein